jgi:hypothetical protein
MNPSEGFVLQGKSLTLSPWLKTEEITASTVSKA